MLDKTGVLCNYSCEYFSVCLRWLTERGIGRGSAKILNLKLEYAIMISKMYHHYTIISLDYCYSCIKKQDFTVVVAWIVTFTWFTD